MVRSGMPDVLYKYYSPRRMDIFYNWGVQFSNPAAFNDTSDMRQSAENNALRLVRYGFRNRVGVFFMSAEPNSQAMWVRYADEHRGFVIGFRTTSGFLTRADSRLESVRYEASAGLLAGCADDCTDRWFYKNPEWSYEREWRCIRKISAELQRSDTFIPEDIAEIVVGPRMADSDINVIFQFIEAVNGSDAGPDDLQARSRLISATREIGSRAIRVSPLGSSRSAAHHSRSGC